MELPKHLRIVGIPHKCSLASGSVEKAAGLTVFLEGPIVGDIAREGTWRGWIEGVPHEQLVGEQFLMITLDDGRQGKVQIISSGEGEATFQGIGALKVPPSPEDEENEILGILNEIRRSSEG